jgi:Asp-tRNA(Asn)/Glu-tRNA(Gln) amidotransferase A subunit family amidase
MGFKMSMNKLFLKYSIPELCQKLEKKELSFSALAVAVSNTIETHEKKTHAWVSYDLDALKTEAKQRDIKFKASGKLRGLEGIPFGIKDIFNTKAFATEMGSPIWKNFTPGNDARVVDSLLFAGGIPVGKTVTAEFAVHALNQTLNPHDASKTPGTSSSGSSAAVATGMVPFALATQTAGSIIRPASFCGIWGMKPSFGMIPRTGVLKTTDSLDTVGFVAAHAKSLRSILDHTRVKGPNYPFVYKNVDAGGAYPKKEGAPWRIGLLKTHTWNSAEGYVQQAIEALAKQIDAEKGFVVEELEWPEFLQMPHHVHSTIYTKSLSHYFQHEKKFSSHVTPIMKRMINEGEEISPEVFKTALQQQAMMIHQLDAVLEPYDLVLSLGTSSSAPLRGVDELPDPSLIWTLGHVPSITAPTSRCPKGLPFGVQVIARKWHDYSLLQGVEALVERGILPHGSQEIRPQKSLKTTCHHDNLVVESI